MDSTLSGGLGVYFTWPWLLFGLLIVAGTAAVVTIGIVYLERQRRRDQRAVEVQTDLTNSLNRELGEQAKSVRPTIQIAAGGRSTVELVGVVDSPDVRASVLTLVQQQMSRVFESVELLDRMEIKGGDPHGPC